jgi:hypothetical protein
VGERVLLLNYEHLAVASPYRSRHAIYVRERAREAHPQMNEVPETLRIRLPSLRAFDGEGMMRGADVVPGRELEPSSNLCLPILPFDTCTHTMPNPVASRPGSIVHEESAPARVGRRSASVGQTSALPRHHGRFHLADQTTIRRYVAPSRNALTQTAGVVEKAAQGHQRTAHSARPLAHGH